MLKPSGKKEQSYSFNYSTALVKPSNHLTKAPHKSVLSSRKRTTKPQALERELSAKSTHCSYRGPGFSSQHPMG